MITKFIITLESNGSSIYYNSIGENGLFGQIFFFQNILKAEKFDTYKSAQDRLFTIKTKGIYKIEEVYVKE